MGRFLAPALLLLAACSAEPDPPGTVTPEEEQALNNAAASLDANTIDAPVTVAADNEVQP